MDKLNTDPVILDIVLKGISSLFKNTLMEPHHYSDKYWLLVASQNQIGWDNFLKGRISTDFATLQDSYITPSQRTPKNNGTTWTTNIAALVMKQWLDLWKQRNEDRHGNDKETKNKARLEQIYHEVELLYSRAHEAPPHTINTIYKCDLDTQLQKHPTELVAWLANWLPVVEAELLRQRHTQT